MQKIKSIFICAGEASGDMHGGELVHTLRNMDPTLQFRAMGSTHLRKAGCKIVMDSTRIAVVGLFEILSHWPDIKAALNKIKSEIIENPPDLLILIDYPEFNLKIARIAKKHGVKVLFYVSPQVWAWRAHRVKKIGRAIDMMAVIFPFETAIYAAENIPVRFVGHPLAGKVIPNLDKLTALQTYGLDAGKKTVGLFPGSRRGEIIRILPILLETAKQIHKQQADVQFILPVASTVSTALIRQISAGHVLPLTLVENQTWNVINCCDSIITASGTVTLEIALLKIPMSIVYRITTLSYFIMSRMIRIPYIGLANIVAGKHIVPEFIQHDAKPGKIADETLHQLYDQTYAASLRAELATVAEKLETRHLQEHALAKLVMELLPRTKTEQKPLK